MYLACTLAQKFWVLLLNRIVWFLQPFEAKATQMLRLHVGKPPYEHEANICTAGLRIKAGELNPRFQLWMLQARGKDYPTAVPPDTLTEKRAAAYYRTSRQSIALGLITCGDIVY